MNQNPGSYLITIERKGYNIHALEWNRGKGWTKCYKEGQSWADSGESLTEKDYAGLLKHFGLQYWRNEFSLSRVLILSPANLIEARRVKEREMRLDDEKHEAFRDGDTHKLPAENFDD